MSDLAQRYGTPRTGNRPWVVALIVVLALAGTGWVLWAAVFHGSPQAHSRLISFATPSQHAATATVTVVREDRDVRASCLLRASAQDHSVVGELNFTVGSSQAASTTVTKRIRTEREATAVELVGCVAEGQAQRR